MDESTGSYLAQLQQGGFRFEIVEEEVPFRTLFDVALRENSLRRFLFVSRITGRHIPTRPSDLVGVAKVLLDKLDTKIDAEATVFFGIAEMATTISQAVFREFCRRGGKGLFIETTRRRTGGDIAFQFEEGHSHAKIHAVHSPGVLDDPNRLFVDATRVVVIDDEATTGNTARALISAYRDWRAANGGREFLPVLGVPIYWGLDQKDGRAPDFDVVSLVNGAFSYKSSCSLEHSVRHRVCLDDGQSFRIGARHGVSKPESLPSSWKKVAFSSGEKILVLGHGEYGFQPFLLGEYLESKGVKVWIQATTRSPALLGGGIQHIRSFPAISGEGFTEFLYNVPDDHEFDRIIWCPEDRLTDNCHPLLSLRGISVLS